jgi:hypothetical protein
MKSEAVPNLGVDLSHRDERLALHLACRAVTLSAD